MQVKGPERLLSETGVLISDTTWRHVLAINSSVEIREKALKAAVGKYGPETPSRWDKVAKEVGSKGKDACKKHAKEMNKGK